MLQLLCYMYFSDFLRGCSFKEAYLSTFLFEKNVHLFIIHPHSVKSQVVIYSISVDIWRNHLKKQKKNRLVKNENNLQ